MKRFTELPIPEKENMLSYILASRGAWFCSGGVIDQLGVTGMSSLLDDCR